MTRRPNYRQDRAERTRTKQARKLEKLQRKNDLAARRKAHGPEAEAPDAPADEAEAKDGE